MTELLVALTCWLAFWLWRDVVRPFRLRGTLNHAFNRLTPTLLPPAPQTPTPTTAPHTADDAEVSPAPQLADDDGPPRYDQSADATDTTDVIDPTDIVEFDGQRLRVNKAHWAVATMPTSHWCRSQPLALTSLVSLAASPPLSPLQLFNQQRECRIDDMVLRVIYPLGKQFWFLKEGVLPPTLLVERNRKGLLKLTSFDKSFGVKSTKYVPKGEPDELAALTYFTPAVRDFFMEHPEVGIARGALTIRWQEYVRTPAQVAQAINDAIALAREFFALWGDASPTRRLQHRLQHDERRYVRLRSLQFLLIEATPIARISALLSLHDGDPEIRLTGALHLASRLGRPEIAFDVLCHLAELPSLSWRERHLALEGLFLHYRLTRLLPLLRRLMDEARRPHDDALMAYIIRRTGMCNTPAREAFLRSLLDLPHCAQHPDLYRELGRSAETAETLQRLRDTADSLTALPPKREKLLQRTILQLEARLKRLLSGHISVSDESSPEGGVSVLDGLSLD